MKDPSKNNIPSRAILSYHLESLRIISDGLKNFKYINLNDYSSLFTDTNSIHHTDIDILIKNKIPYGGFLEDRTSFCEIESSPTPTLHLGQDIWLPSTCQINSHVEGTVIFKYYNSIFESGGRIDILTSDNHVFSFCNLGYELPDLDSKIQVNQKLGMLQVNKNNLHFTPHLHVQKCTLRHYNLYDDPLDLSFYWELSGNIRTLKLNHLDPLLP